MSLNIKSEEAHRMARELASRTGESLTTAVTEALRERLDRVRREREDLAERILAIGRDCAARLKSPLSNAEIDDLYDEDGLPR
jgi:antitoxin VapB